jgi:hypothetical protein
MTQIRYLFYLTVFAFSLLFSRQLSLQIFHPQLQINPITQSAKATEPEDNLISSQVNLVILHTNNLKDSFLVSAWWVAIAPDSPITLINIYPTSNFTDSSPRLLQQYFRLEHSQRKNPGLSQAFLQQLSRDDIPWDGYIVVDDEALSMIVDYLGGVNIGENHYDGLHAASNIHRFASSPDPKLQFQSALWEAICQKTIFASSSTSFELIRTELQSHTVLSPNFPFTMDEFQAFNAVNENLSCHAISTPAGPSSGSPDIPARVSPEE